MAKIAEGLGYSDVGLKKACKRLGVALPPYGYWHRRSAGQSHEEALQPPPPPLYRKLTKEIETKIHELLLRGLSIRQIAKEVGYHHTTISRFIRRNKLAQSLLETTS
jgi:DNA-binding NarL/FixJ family response regulator